MILIVEDNPINQEVISAQLKKLGHPFEIASSGEEALKQLQTQSYKLVLMDCQMPEMDGFETTIQFRKTEPTTQHLPIIALTALALDGDKEKCLAAGMDDYVTKPLRLEALRAVLQKWLK